jgi:hypothetical protein
MRRPKLAVVCLALGLSGCNKTSPAREQAGDAREQPSAADESPGPLVEAEPAAFTEEPCAYAMAVVERLDVYRGVDRPLDPARPEQILRREQGGHSALEWLAQTDRALGRVSKGQPEDLVAVESVLAQLGKGEGDQDQLRRDLTAIVTRMRAVALLEMRRLLAEVADDHLHGAEAAAAWDEARCLWEGGLRGLAARAEALPARGGEGWEATIAEAFETGRAALDEPGPEGVAVEVKAAKQQIEKGMYAVAHRLILADAEQHDAVAAAEALGLLDALEDRLADRNGPGLARMREMLAGDPAAIDVAAVERDLAIAFAKRARKYCDKAVVGGELGRPQAVAETWEGIVYTRVILPSMREALVDEGFDADAYLADWQRYLEAVEAGEAGVAGEICGRLVEWNCAYQDRLGIAECTATENESQ